MVLDKSGSVLQPFDMVQIGDIPQHYWSDDDFSSLRLYGRGYGLITYFGEQFQYFGRQDHSAWLDPANTHVNVLCVRADDEAVSSYSFWLPVTSIKKIRYNLVLANLFARLPLQMESSDGEAVFMFGRDSEFYKLVRKISIVPIGELERLSNYVSDALDRRVDSIDSNGEAGKK